MKVAFLNCTDELNPKAGSELTCVFLDKIPGTLEFCKKLKLKDPNLYFDAYVHNGQHVNASYGYLKAGVPATVEESLMYYHTGCPVCAGRKVVPSINDLATKYPKVSAMWSDKNDYTPREISARSERRAIFVCPDCKKEFVTSVRAMTRAIASGATCCPDCKMRMRTISAARKDEHDYAKSVGTTMAMKDGSKATCTAYHGVNNITVEFEDGFVLYHARWNQFVRGTLHHDEKNINK